jgi:hypothetical protein
LEKRLTNGKEQVLAVITSFLANFFSLQKILHSEKKYKEYYDRYSDKKKELEMVEQIIKENAALLK